MCEIMEKFGERIRLQSEAEGEAEGKAKGRLNTLVELVREGMLDMKNAAQKAGMTTEAFQKLVAATV